MLLQWLPVRQRKNPTVGPYITEWSQTKCMIDQRVTFRPLRSSGTFSSWYSALYVLI